MLFYRVRAIAWLAWVFAIVLASCTFANPPCGGSGNSCCTTGSRCNAGLSCSGGFLPTCQACGSLGNACCDIGLPCSTGLGCVSGGAFGSPTCERCGAMGEPCCSNVCINGLACVPSGSAGSSTCLTCGGAGQPCCPGSQCHDSLACNDTGTCGACGASGEPCCAGSTCTGPARCVTSSTRPHGTCTVCGGAGQPCCSGTMCDGNALFCRAGQCQPCGALREVCCAGDNCPTSGSCIGGICTASTPDASVISGACTPGACDFAGMICVPFAASICSRPCIHDSECAPTGACFNGICALHCTPGAADCDQYGGICLGAIEPFPLLSSSSVAAPNVCVPSCFAASAALPSGYPACATGSTCDPVSGGCVTDTPRAASIGAPCTGSSDCAGTCIGATTAMGATTGFVGGYCVTLARRPEPDALAPGAPLPASNCAPGGVAIPTPESGRGDAVYCYATCMNDCDCRVGYRCDHDPLRLHAASPNGACLPMDCSASGASCPSGTTCQTAVSATYLRYPVCAPLAGAGIDGGVVPVGHNTGCTSPDASTPAMDASIDAMAGG